MADHLSKKSEDSTPRPYAVLAHFSDVDPLLHAARSVRDAGFTRWDVHTPFPVHGLDRAMGLRPTRLPWLVLAAGIAGVGAAIALQWWTNAVDYPFAISGKPYFSLPANIPIAFELAVLFGAFATFFGALALNRLPELFHPLLNHHRFRRVTDDGFCLVIEVSDPLYDPHTTRALLETLRADVVEELTTNTPASSYKLPRMLVAFAAIAAVATLVPLALIAQARETQTEKPRVHVVPDMDWQPKAKTQTASLLFADGRAMRQAPEGTVPWRDSREDILFSQGRSGLDGPFVTVFPPSLPLTRETMERGRERFGIACAPCHGLAGYGDGLIAQRADKLAEGAWVPPTSLHAEHVRGQPVGQLWHTLSYGIRNMPGYASQVTEGDRWAIVLYLKALQLSQRAPAEAVPQDILKTLIP